MNTHHAQGIMKFTPLVARILLSALFIMGGISKITGFAGTVGYIESFGLPFAALGAVIAIVIELVGGIMILVGFQARLAAWVLAGFTVIAGAIFHSDFSNQMEMIMFMKNLGIAGGFLLIAVHGPGPFSLDAKGTTHEGTDETL